MMYEDRIARQAKDQGRCFQYLRISWIWSVVGISVFWISYDQNLQAQTQSIPYTRSAAAIGYIDSLRVVHRLPALSVAVAKDGQVIWEYAVGWADSSMAREATSSSSFRIGSVSKLFTATAAVRLWEQGILELDSAIHRYVPEAPMSDPPITVRSLAGHLSGIRHYDRSDFVNIVNFPDLNASLVRFINEPLIASPGERYSYSSYGYNLLGLALERATGKSFETIIEQEVTDPLLIEGIIASDTVAHSNEVRYYSRDQQGGLEEEIFVDLSDRLPSGGYIGTASDLAKFGSAVFQPGYLTEAGRALMLNSMRTTDNSDTNVGFGWRLMSDEQEQLVAYHGGQSMGSRAFLITYPDDRTAIAIVTNLSFAPVGLEEALRVGKLILQE